MKDITLYELNSLDEVEKGAALWEYGVHLTQRFDGDIGYSLYQLNNFYVEIMYNGGINEITKALIKFRNERDWEQFHNPKDLAIAISAEAGELLELFLWKNPEEANID